jgi:Schitoviridae HNH endonuclease
MPSVPTTPMPSVPTTEPPSEKKRRPSPLDYRTFSRLPAETRISLAKGLVSRHSPFYSTLLFNLPLVVTPLVPTAAVSKTTLYFNPDFARRLKMSELVFVLCHEVLHVALGHTWRMIGPGWKRKQVNTAQDLVINDILTRSFPIGVATMPVDKHGGPVGLVWPELVAEAEGIAEVVYELLEKRPKPPENRGSEVGFDEILTEAEAEELGLEPELDLSAGDVEAQVQLMVGQALAAQKSNTAGSISANLLRQVQEILEPQVPWQTLLRRFCTMRLAERQERSWRRLSRRSFGSGLMLPSAEPGESMGPLAVAIDCSGSIGSQELAEFAAEIRSIAYDCRPSRLHLIYFDSSVCHEAVFGPGEEIEVSPHGGGGTAFSPAIRAALASDDEEPAAIIFLTDLLCHDFGPPPPMPTLWVVTSGLTEAPFGEVIQMHPEKRKA